MSTLSFTPPARKSAVVPIVIEPGAVKDLRKIAERMEGVDRVAILFDAAVRPIAEVISSAFAESVLLEVPSGEASKRLSEVERITKAMLEAHITRGSLLIAVGGGMLTDLAGFVASIYMRGIRFVSIPTTFLAMVDAAVGGKTGVDLGEVKNILGTIEHPIAIVMDTDTLGSLPDKHLREGLVEVMKMAAVLDLKSFQWLEKYLPNVLSRQSRAIVSCIEHAVAMKVRIVEADEREKGQRMLLNFGHTVGHAVEGLSKFALSHGTCVSIGMAAEMRIARFEDVERVTSLLRMLDMPTDIPSAYPLDQIWDLMQSDKKVRGGEVRIAVPEVIGAGVVRSITKEEFLRSVR